MESIKKYKYLFKLQIQSITLDYNSSFNFKIVFKISNQPAETKVSFKYEAPGLKQVLINESFQFITVLPDDQTTEKIAKFYIYVLTSKGYKQVTFGDFNLFEEQLEVNSEKNWVKEPQFIKSPFTHTKMEISISGLKSELENDEVNFSQTDLFTNISANNNANLKKTSLSSHNGLLSEPNSVTSSVKTNSDSKTDYSSEIKVLNKKVEQLEASLDKSQNDYNILEKENNELKEKIESINGKLKDKIETINVSNYK